MAGALAGLLICGVLRLALRFGKLQSHPLVQPLVIRCSRVLGILLPAVGAYPSLPWAVEGALPKATEVAGRSVTLMLSDWLLMRSVFAAEDLLTGRLGLSATDDLSARRTYTQLQVLRSVLVAFIVFGTAALMLVSLPGFRQVA